ncbi:hypothetical protein K3N28_05920 [Glycomyces sp. TRM65418]|uniref:hypothetical protein n=1 Tax=Glycomyces sp. TRM65418 TaxID=2867006 RepID=UPI001CE4E372|nr:hypothetical protein [Glycomyces sp. TRM65418]MCC3762606.1 hypothetical protein [Glycomyces sp. TRM65418]QZD56644.1 hypothetical protein K3N28_05880 [Glycomyces sp. TRM65418]
MSGPDITTRSGQPEIALPSLDEAMVSSGQLAPVVGSAAAPQPEAPSCRAWFRPATAIGLMKRPLPRRVKLALRLVAIALVLTIALAAGIAAGALLIAWIAAQLQGAPSTDAVRIPISTGTIIIAVVALGFGSRYGAAKFSEHKYPHFSCEACKGGGKDFEPRWLQLMRWGRRRAWRKCPACDGNPIENR